MIIAHTLLLYIIRCYIIIVHTMIRRLCYMIIPYLGVDNSKVPYHSVDNDHVAWVPYHSVDNDHVAWVPYHSVDNDHVA